MKRTYIHIFITCLVGALSTLAVSSCRKAETSNQSFEDGEIVLRVDDDFTVDTKAIDVVPTHLCCAATSVSLSHGMLKETEEWILTNAAVIEGRISTGHYWEEKEYNFYAANRTISNNQTIDVDLSSSLEPDVIVGRVANITSGEPNIVMHHILSRITGFSITTKPGSELTNVNIILLARTEGGAYNLSSMSWGKTIRGGNIELLSVPTMNSSRVYEYECDHYFVPGTYTLVLNYGLDSSPSQSYSATVTLEEEKAYIINAEIGCDGEEIQIGVSLAPWGRKNTARFARHEYPSFGGVNIAPGPLLYTGTDYVIQPSWKIGSYSIGLLTGSAGSIYHRYEQLGKYFSSRGNAFTLSSGIGIDNQGNNVSYNGYDDWRMPTYSEYDKIINGPRTGSSVAGTPGCRYAFVRVTGYNFDDMGDPFYGLLLFPDNQYITMPAGGISCNTTTVQEMSISVLNYIINKGCVFLPACGSRNPPEAALRGIGTTCYYHCATSSGTSSIYCLYADDEIVSIKTLSDYPGSEYMPIRLVRNAE